MIDVMKIFKDISVQNVENTSLGGKAQGFGSSQNSTIEKEDENNLVEIKSVEKKEEKKGFFQPIKEFFSNIGKAIGSFIGSIFSKDKSEKSENSEEVEKPTKISQKIKDYQELSKEDPKYTVNGKIDQDFHQGSVADCMLLSSMYSLSRTEGGSKIIQDAIKTNYDENGNTKSYDVYFKGLDKTYNIPVEEYMEAERLRPQYQRGEVEYYLSSGDDDMLLMELAYKKAFDDISEAKSSSSLFGGKKQALESVEYEQFLYAFVGTEDINEEFWVEKKYSDKQIQQYKSEIMNIFETQKEFKLEDVYKSDMNIAATSINGFEFDFEGTYVIEQKPSQTEDGKITVKNKETGEVVTLSADSLISSFAGNLTTENERNVASEMYDAAVKSKFVVFGNESYEPVEITDINGKTCSICQKHAYGVKEITQEYLTLVNPHNSQEITMTKEEYLKHHEAFDIFSADFEE